MPFSDYVIDVIKANKLSELKEIFDFVEFLLRNGDDTVQAAITTGFLEDLIDKDPKEIQFKYFCHLLGKNTLNYCRAWNEFNNFKTEGLWED